MCAEEDTTMARCPDCNKFTGKNVDEEPETTGDLEIDDDGEAKMSVKIVNQCEDCSTDIEEYEFELEGKIDRGEHTGEGHELEWDDPDIERTDSGGGRYAKRMFGVIVTAKINCECGDSVDDLEMKDEVASSHMESLI